MIWPTYLLYVFLVGLIRTYKCVEFQILKLFNPFSKKKGKELSLSIGVVLHCPGDSENFSEEEHQLLLQRGKKYDKVVHIKVNDKLFFAKMANTGSLALGETYMDKTWEWMENVEDVSELTTRIMESKFVHSYYNRWNTLLEWLELYAFNLQTRQRAFQVGKTHYDLGECGNINKN